MKILCTCPPMARAIGQFSEEFSRRRAEVFCPPVQQVLPEEELVALVPQFDGWIIGDDPATARVFAAGQAGRLRAAVKWGVGVDNVDFAACRRLGLPISHTPGMFGEEVSDVALGYVIGLARGLFTIDRGVRTGIWPKPAGMSLRGKTAALAGFGNIGRATARKLLAFGLRVVVYDPFYQAGDPALPVEPAQWPDRLSEADFVVLTCALTPSSQKMLNADTIARCQDGVLVVNVGRGGLIDEAALEQALFTRKVAGAALDVFETEPLPAPSRLRTFPQCVFGSHNSSNTVEAVDRTSRRAIGMLFDALTPLK